MKKILFLLCLLPLLSSAQNTFVTGDSTLKLLVKGLRDSLPPAFQRTIAHSDSGLAGKVDTSVATALVNGISNRIKADSFNLATLSANKLKTILGYSPYDDKNPAGYTTISAVSSAIVPLIPSATSQLTNNSDYITSSSLSSYATTSAVANLAASTKALYTNITDKTISNTTTETSIFPSGASTNLTLAAGFWTVNKAVRFKVTGYFSTPLTLVPTLTITIKLNGTAIATGSAASLVASANNNFFESEGLLICRSTGTSGTVLFTGRGLYAGLAGAINSVSLNQTSPTIINTTTSNVIDITATWSNNNSTIVFKNIVVDVVNP